MARRETARTGGTTMGPTPREWLGAGLLALVLVALVVLLVSAAMPAGEAEEAVDAAVRALLGA
jgi:hypothetical protein